MTLQQYSAYRSLKMLHSQYITDDYIKPDGVVLVIQYKDPNKLYRMVEIDKDGRCKVTTFEEKGAYLQEVVLPREGSFIKNRKKVQK